MSILKHPLVLAMAFVAIAVYLSGVFGFELPKTIRHYLNDLLCMPLVLSLSLAVIRILKKNNQLYVPFITVALVTLYYSLHFEWLLPKFNPRYTADAMDVVLYGFGAMLFYKFQKRLF